MATAQSLPQQPIAPPPVAPPLPSDLGKAAGSVEQALVPSHRSPAAAPGIVLSGAIARLPVELDVAVPVRDFRVRNLLSMEPGLVIETQWAHGEDMPLASGDVQLAWSEFEVIETQLAVRVTRLV
jgi:flagellar motor switch protein FliM